MSTREIVLLSIITTITIILLGVNIWISYLYMSGVIINGLIFGFWIIMFIISFGTLVVAMDFTSTKE
jgi:hypothetical protein